jgi:hypothetical protein
MKWPSKEEVVNQTKMEEIMTVQSQPSHEELISKAKNLNTLADLIQEYPAEAQLIMAAVQDGIAIGPAKLAEHTCPIVITLDESGTLHAPGDD